MKKCMKRILMLAVLGVVTTHVARADHSLSQAMSSNPKIKLAVQTMMSAKGVVCDVEESSQLAVAEAGSRAWRQIALCFENQKTMMAARKQFRQGNELGFYGVTGIVGILDVTYTWDLVAENGKYAGQILSINLR